MILPGILASAALNQHGGYGSFLVTFKKRSIPGTGVNPGYPFHVDLSRMPAEFWLGVKPDGSNIRASQNGIEVATDLVAIDVEAKTGFLFAKVSVDRGLGGSFTIYTDGGTAYDPDSPLGAKAVWELFVAAVHGGANLERKSRTPFTLGPDATFNGTAFVGIKSSDSYARVDLTGSTFDPTAWGFVSIHSRDVLNSQNQCVLSLSPWQSANSGRDIVAFRAATQIGAWNSTNNWMTGSVPSAPPTTKESFCYTRQQGSGRYLYYNGGADPIASSSAASARPVGEGINWILGAEDSDAAESFVGKIYFAAVTPGYTTYWYGAIHDNFLTSDWYSITAA